MRKAWFNRTSSASSRAAYEGRSDQSKGTPVSMETSGICSTVLMAATRYWRASSLSTGASAYPQLAVTTVVTPKLEDGCQVGVPEQVGVEVGVRIDEAGGEDQITAVHLLGGATADVAAHLGQQPVAHGDITLGHRPPGAVDDGRVAEDQLIVGRQLPWIPPSDSRPRERSPPTSR